MSAFFEIPHIFVVFPAGCGGNFITGLLHKLVNRQLNPVVISPIGSSHTLVNKKELGTDFLSFTTKSQQHSLFNSDDERISYYIENIKKNYIDITVPEVVWTHDFTNIPVYRKYFKNARILVITAFSDKERLTSIIMHIIKTVLDKDARIPLRKDEWENTIIQWTIHCRPILEKLVPGNQVDIILADRFNLAYKELLTFATAKLFSLYFQCPGLVDSTLGERVGVFDNVLYQSVDPRIPYRVGPKVEEFIDSVCEILPYNYLANNEVNLLIEKMSLILSRELTSEERIFIAAEFTKYRSAQDQKLLVDPVQYFNDLELKLNYLKPDKKK
jgi:hypothetical protein